MIPEVAILDKIPDKTAEFEVRFHKAQDIISSVNGWLGYQLQQRLEVPNRYIFTCSPAACGRSVVEHYSLKFEK